MEEILVELNVSRGITCFFGSVNKASGRILNTYSPDRFVFLSSPVCVLDDSPSLTQPVWFVLGLLRISRELPHLPKAEEGCVLHRFG